MAKSRSDGERARLRLQTLFGSMGMRLAFRIRVSPDTLISSAGKDDKYRGSPKFLIVQGQRQDSSRTLTSSGIASPIQVR